MRRPCPNRQYRVSVKRASLACVETERLAPLGQGDDVAQLFRTRFKKATDVAGRLADALLVLHERDTHVSFAVLAKANARRNRDLCLFDQERRKFHAAESLERLRHRRPGEHGGAWRRNLAAGT